MIFLFKNLKIIFVSSQGMHYFLMTVDTLEALSTFPVRVTSLYFIFILMNVRQGSNQIPRLINSDTSENPYALSSYVKSKYYPTFLFFYFNLRHSSRLLKSGNALIKLIIFRRELLQFLIHFYRDTQLRCEMLSTVSRKRYFWYFSENVIIWININVFVVATPIWLNL